MRYGWTHTGTATYDTREWRYQLTMEKQPGMSAEEVNTVIDLPEGARITSVTHGAQIAGSRVTWSPTLTTDEQLRITYQLP